MKEREKGGGDGVATEAQLYDSYMTIPLLGHPFKNKFRGMALCSHGRMDCGFGDKKNTLRRRAQWPVTPLTGSLGAAAVLS